MSERFTLRFIRSEKIAKKTYSFYFDRRDHKFDFIAGEYIRMTLDIARPDSRGSSRYFTIASSPNDTKHIIVTTKVIRSTFKKHLLKSRKGELVRFFGPMGNFTLGKNKKQKIFLSGGMGITTFYSMILYSAQAKSTQPITLIAFFSDRENFIYEQELRRISKGSPSIKINYFSSKESGRISKEIIKNYSNIKNSEFYVVGPPSFVETTRDMLEELGVREKNINLEDFTGY